MIRIDFFRPAAAALARHAGFVALVMLSCGLAAGPCRAAGNPPAIGSLVGVDGAGNPKLDDSGKPTESGGAAVALNGWLAVVLKGDTPTTIDPAKTVLFLDGREITGLKDTRYLANLKALVFHLVRSSDNASAWEPLLASPTFQPRTATLGLWLEKPAAGTSPLPPLIAGENGAPAAFKLVLIPGYWWLGAIVVLLVAAVVGCAALKTNLLKDSLLPQLAPKEQPFSLGRSQMAFWFVLIFAVYIFLYFLMWDYNTITNQSLILMGLSGATAIFAVAIDASKDTPIGAANEKLRAIDLNTYSDVVKLDAEIAQRQAALKDTPAADNATILRLQTEITDRLNKKRTCHEITRPYVSEGWYRDLTTDINGPALHRLQILVWTVTLGGVFLIQTFHTVSMPQFSDTLLALMGVTSAGYLGFKYPEKQN
ncbi:MAG: hypothetical protein ACHQAY_26835 [Hyphomicrobiales bacterium]